MIAQKPRQPRPRPAGSFSQEIELRGHIIDSLTLPKVLDEILLQGGDFRMLDVNLGKKRADPTYARIEVSGPTPEMVDDLVRRLRSHGAEIIDEGDAQFEPAPGDGVFPENFHVTTNQQSYIRISGEWVEVLPATMDSGIAVDPDSREATTVKFYQVKKGMLIAVGHRGIRVVPQERSPDKRGIFEFMSSSVSTEKPKIALIRRIAEEIREAREAGGKILVVGGPAIVHTDGIGHMERLIEAGYVQLLFAGNALAAHDIEHALYGTSLGVYLHRAALAEEGHQNHIRAINAIRAVGGIRQAVEKGVLRSGIMHHCVRHGVDYVLAGSIRDDGPLPEVITDAIEAQKAMRSKLSGVSIALMMGTMLHSIAVGNLLPATVRTICADINPTVVTKLADRGSFQVIGLVTDIEPFLRELTEFLLTNHAAPASMSA
jgi:lysine-ketoglutarate reductase/saccharopine dehydrogenase-like protein (TIGR00300 family)